MAPFFSFWQDLGRFFGLSPSGMGFGVLWFLDSAPDDGADFLHNLEEFLVFVGIDDEARTVGGDGEKIGVDFALDPGHRLSPRFHAEELFFYCGALDLYLDAQVLEIGGRFGGDDDLSGDTSIFRALEERDSPADKAPGVEAAFVDVNGKIGRFKGG